MSRNSLCALRLNAKNIHVQYLCKMNELEGCISGDNILLIRAPVYSHPLIDSL